MTYLLIHFIASTQQSSRPALSRSINLIRTLHRRAYRITLRRSSRTIASSRLPDISLISSNYMAIRSFHYVYETLNLLANRCSIGLKHRLVRRHEKVTLPDNYLRKDYEQRRECSFNYYVVTSNTTTIVALRLNERREAATATVVDSDIRRVVVGTPVTACFSDTPHQQSFKLQLLERSYTVVRPQQCHEVARRAGTLPTRTLFDSSHISLISRLRVKISIAATQMASVRRL